MTIEELKTAPLTKLMQLLNILEEQSQRNIVIFEIVCRLYVPFKDKTFEEMLLELGYEPSKEINIDKQNTK